MSTPFHRGLRLACGLIALSPLLESAATDSHYLPLFGDPAPFTAAIDSESGPVLPEGQVTGITVPHHLPAADLIARGFRLASKGRYERIIILFPDHFLQSPHAACVAQRGFRSVLGDVPLDVDGAARLLDRLPDVVGTSDLFARDHGLQILLPFVAHYFPEAKILPISLHLSRRQEAWDALVAGLVPLVTPSTLIIQSTDFSHYLPWAQARAHDQQTLNTLASGDPTALAWLKQPAHLDSSAAQYIHSALQLAVHGAIPEAIENRNSQEVLGWRGAATTSYIVQVFRKPGPHIRPIPPWPGQHVYFFAGDTFFGRHLAAPLRRPGVRENLRDHILALTGGAPLILNLEGVALDGTAPISSQRNPGLAMDAAFTLEWLQSLRVAAVSLANNHSHDFGKAAAREMKARFEVAGIVALGHMETHDFGPFRLLALNDVHSHRNPHTPRLAATDWDAIAATPRTPPTVAFLHWGEEGTSSIAPPQIALMHRLRRHGIPIALGAHSHVASERVLPLAAGRIAGVPSMGNFLFDQPAAERAGCLVELRIFSQGTCSLRIQPLGNLYQKILAGEFAGPP